MRKHLLLVPAMLAVLAVPASVTGQGRIKCVDTPPGIDGDPDPDTFCPEDYGTDPRGARTTGSDQELADVVAEHDAKAPAEPE